MSRIYEAIKYNIIRIWVEDGKEVRIHQTCKKAKVF
jgi:hypothetical protein